MIELMYKMDMLEKEIQQLRQENIMLHEINDQHNKLNGELRKEISELQNNIYKARKMIFDNYGVLDKYGIEMLDDILKGEDNE